MKSVLLNTTDHPASKVSSSNLKKGKNLINKILKVVLPISLAFILYIEGYGILAAIAVAVIYFMYFGYKLFADINSIDLNFSNDGMELEEIIEDLWN